MFITISATILVTALVLVIGFWAWLETYMVYSTVVSIWPSYRVSVPGKPAVSARLYWLGSPRVGRGGENLLVLTSKSAKHCEFYWIDMSRREIGLVGCPKYVPLLDGAIVDRITLLKYPLELELKAEWSVKKTEVRIRIIGFSDAAIKAGGVSAQNEDENARRRIPIGYQREIVFTKVPTR